MNRRDFLRTTTCAAAALQLPAGLHAEPIPTTSVELTIEATPGHAIPKDFLGLSYETAQLENPDYFSAENTELAGFLRTLGTGVLRIGGNTSEYAFWTPEPKATKTPATRNAVGPDAGHHAPVPTQTTPRAIRNLRGFLDAVNWRAMYGLNFGKGTPAEAAAEAAFVAETLGERLISFQIGNEADLFPNNGLRPKNYSFDDFSREWTAFHDVVKARVPGAKFAGPDTAGTSDWLVKFAQRFGSQVNLLTTHYYALGPASDPSMNIDRLLQPNSRWEKGVPKIREAMAESHLPYRLAETNSCYGGGKPDVSNTFASSLWALDLMFQLLSIGGSGINFHGGGYGWYAPVVGTRENGFVARPEYYALLVMAKLAGGRMVSSRLGAGEANPLLAAYAARDAQGRLRAVAINKNSQQDVRLTVDAPPSGSGITMERLIAPRLEDQQDTTFAGAQV
jgi:hypothetical protein